MYSRVSLPKKLFEKILRYFSVTLPNFSICSSVAFSFERHFPTNGQSFLAVAHEIIKNEHIEMVTILLILCITIIIPTPYLSAL